MSALIRFQVSAPNPDDHLLCVRLEIDGVAETDHLDLSMPVWSPGSYLVREYARHIQNLEVVDEDQDRRRTRKIDKATWRVDTARCQSVVVRYELFAHDLNVRANHLDDTHAFFTGVATYLYPKGRLDEAVDLEVVAPAGSDWQVYTGLSRRGADGWHFEAPNFDVLFDSPVEMGDHDPLEFAVDGTSHQMIFWGPGNYDRDALAADLPDIVAANAELFGGLPYDDYLFITLLSDVGGGGLEHRNSTALLYPQNNFGRGDDPGGVDDGYLNFLRLACHEHFHAWNVKRIRPARLGPFDYQHENYTRDLWTVEGITSYYDTLGLLRAGIIDADAYVSRLLKLIHRLERVPGRKLDSLEDASFDAWIKLYRADEHTRNSTVSYYLKGELVCALLDVRLRAATDGQSSLDDVLRHLWNHYYVGGDIGYPEGAYEQIIREVTGVDIGDFFDAYIRGADALAWNDLLAPVGLELTRQSSADDQPWLGATTRSSNTNSCAAAVSFVPTASPAHRAGIYAGDEIIAVDGFKIEPGNLAAALDTHRPGDRVDVHVFRRGQLRRCRVELGSAPPDIYNIDTRSDADQHARQLLEGWLGVDQITAEYRG